MLSSSNVSMGLLPRSRELTGPSYSKPSVGPGGHTQAAARWTTESPYCTWPLVVAGRRGCGHRNWLRVPPAQGDRSLVIDRQSGAMGDAHDGRPGEPLGERVVDLLLAVIVQR